MPYLTFVNFYPVPANDSSEHKKLPHIKSNYLSLNSPVYILAVHQILNEDFPELVVLDIELACKVFASPTGWHFLSVTFCSKRQK